MSGEKTEQPTARRQRRARREGDIAVSAAVTQGASLLVAVALLPVFVSATTVYTIGLMRRVATLDFDSSAQTLTAVLSDTLILTVPLLAAAAAAALCCGALQTGALFTLKRLSPRLDHLNPIDGLSRLFQLDRTFQVLRSMIVLLLVAYLCWRLIAQHLSSAVASVGSPYKAMVLAGVGTRTLLWYGVAAAIVLALVDFLVVRRSWLNRLKMSRDELKQEHKEAEGDPQLQQERRRAHQELLNSATLAAVKNASVVIVNPTHLASALYYDEAQTEAPRVVAQGQGVLARQIVDAARAYGVPIVRDVPVARALHELAIGDEIPEVLYEAVAEILRAVWKESGEAID